MPDYKNKRFERKPFNRGGAPHFNGPKQLYKAECANCNATCEVPFRPNGKKPVYCSNCFKRDDDRDARPFQKREFTPRQSFAPRTAAPQEDRRIDDLKRQLTTLEAKMDRILLLVEEKPAAATPVKKAAPKKVAKKATKKAK